MNAVPMKPTFEIIESIKRGWEIFAKNVALLIGCVLICAVIIVVTGILTFDILPVVLAGPLAYGLASIALRLVRGQPADFGMLFSGFSKFLPTFLTGLLVALFIGIGGVLCIIPGFIVEILYLPVFFYLVDREGDFWPLMETCRKDVWGNFGQWVLIFLSVLALMFIGGLLCVVGTLVTCPLAMLLVAMAYEKVIPRSGAAATPSGPTEPTPEPQA